MTWTPPTKPVNWQDTPSTSTAVDAANLNADESFAVTVGTSVVSYFETSTSMVSSAAQTSPLLFAEAWGAKGNAKRVTDGAITTGTNTLSSTAASFTSADTGKRVDVVGAGPAGAGAGTLFAFIGTVTSGVASLVTTSGGSTPANATSTVSGAMVTYGTEDTTAVQSAMTAVSTAGGGVVHLTPGKAYFVNTLTPVSNVTVRAYGATIYFTSYNNNCGFQLSSGGAISNFGVYGATMPYDGVSYGSGTRAAVFINVAGSTDLRFYDNTITNNKDAGIYLSDCARTWVVNNTVQNCCQAAGRNAISVNTATGQATDAHVVGNYVDGCPSIAMAFVTVGGATMTTWTYRAVVTGNTIVGTSTVGSGIWFEGGGSGPGGGGSKVTIADNVIDMSASATTSGNGITVSQGINEGDWLQFAITGNYVTNPHGGISVNASNATVTGNVVESSGTGIATVHASQSVTATTDGTTAVLTSVTIPSGSQTQVQNGDAVSGTGIPAGSYLVSGAGTATWTISQNTTAAGTVAVAAQVTCTNVSVASNVVHMAANSTGQGISFTNVSYGALVGNVVSFDQGSSSGSFGIHVQSCFDVNVANNSTFYSPAEGMRVRSSHDVLVTGNFLLNSSTAGGTVAGLDLYGLTGTDNTIAMNRIVDDRGTPLMKYAIQTTLAGVGISANLRIRGNTFAGFVTAAIDALTYVVEAKNNAGYNPVGAVTVTVPATTVAVASQPYDRTFYVTAGASTCTLAIQNGPSPVIPSAAFGTVRVPAGKTLTPTFTSAPTWVVEGE